MSLDEDAELEKIISLAKQHVRAELESEFQKRMSLITESVLNVNKDLASNLKSLKNTLTELLAVVKDFDKKQKAIKKILLEVFGEKKRGKRKNETERRPYIT